MGVKGLWKLLDGTGRPINLEALEGKILAVDVSVWLNMAIKGMRDYHGNASASAHLTTLFNRICKLLYYGVKPVFVFDGQPPALKQKTLRERRERKNFNVQESKKAGQKIIQNYLKKQILQEAAVKSLQEDKPSTSKDPLEPSAILKPTKVKSQDKDIYDMPPLSRQLNDSDQDDLEEELKIRTELQTEYLADDGDVDIASIMNMDIDSKDFASLPSDVQYELLKDLKEIRKRRRTRLEAMPEGSNSFSDYQITGLLAKRKISKKMEHVEKKMSEENLAMSSALSGFSSNITKDHVIDARQLVSDSTSHYIWMRKANGKGNESYSAAEEVQSSATCHIKFTDKANDENNRSCERLEEYSSSDHECTKAPTFPEKTETELTTFRKSQSDAEREPSPNLAVLDLINKNVESFQHPTSGSCNKIGEINEEEECLAKEPHVVTNTENSLFSPKITSQKNPMARSNVIKETQTVPASQNTRVDGAIGIFQPVVHPLADASLSSRNERQVIELESESSDEEFIDVPEQNYKIVTSAAESENTGENKTTTDERSDNDATSMDENPWKGLDTEDVETFTAQIDEQSKELHKLMMAKERAARDLTQSAQMECQELLKLFGLPYIVSPQEAEAQCATLELLGLTHGSITEDSDIWLFGGRYVIKDMFGSRSDPVSFQLTDIEMQLGLTRDRFICIALCSGSDYTTGIRGVGPVTAMEILKEFEGEGIEGLVNLRQWWDKESCNTKQAVPTETKIKSLLKKVNLRKDFPSPAVYQAYTEPVVDEDRKEFEWGFPDLDELRMFATSTMGWTKQKVDEILLPVIKRLGQRRSVQTRITHFLPATLQTAKKKKSKRVMRAAAVLTRTQKEKVAESVPKKKLGRSANSGKRRKVAAHKETKLNLSESSSDGD